MMSHITRSACFTYRFRLGRGILHAALSLLVGTGTIRVAAAAALQPLRMDIVGEQEMVLPYGSDRCLETGKPDAPFRAVVSRGEIVGYLSYIRNRLLIGTDLAHLVPTCTNALVGQENPDPAAHSDRDWIAAVWPLHGGEPDRFGALVHDEYQPHRFPGRCAFRDYMKCWYNTITYAESVDGGRTFQLKGEVAIAPSFRADFEQGRHRGFFNPSNIVSYGGYNWTLVHTTGGGIQQPGVCLFRNDPMGAPWDWRGWDGTDFSYRPLDPYRFDYKSITRGCKPVDELSSYVGSVVRNSSGKFLAISVKDFGSEPKIAITTSEDLIRWSPLTKLMDLPTMWSKNCSDEFRYGYGALVPNQPINGRFDLIDDKGYVYLTRFHVKDCKLSEIRDLVRYPARIFP